MGPTTLRSLNSNLRASAFKPLACLATAGLPGTVLSRPHAIARSANRPRAVEGRLGADAVLPELTQLLNGGAISYPDLQALPQTRDTVPTTSQGSEQRE